MKNLLQSKPVSWLQGARPENMPEWIARNPKAFRLLYEFASRARREEGAVVFNGRTIHLKIREFVTGRISTSYKVGISEAEYKNLYRKFARSGLIQTLDSTKQCTIGKFLADGIFFNNYPTNHPTDKPSKQPTTNHQTATINNVKNENNDYIHASPKSERVTSSYKKRCPNVLDGHKGCTEYITSFGENRGVKFPNFGKQINALHKMLSAGFTFSEIDKQIGLLEKDRFWSERGFDLMNVANEIGKGGHHA